MPPYFPAHALVPGAGDFSSSPSRLFLPVGSRGGDADRSGASISLRVTVGGGGGGPSAAVIGGAIAAAAAALAVTTIAVAVAWRRRARRRQAAAAATAGRPPMFMRKPLPWGGGDWDAPQLPAACNNRDGVATVSSPYAPTAVFTVDRGCHPAGDSGHHDARAASDTTAAAAADSTDILAKSPAVPDAGGSGSCDSGVGDGGSVDCGGSRICGGIHGEVKSVRGVPPAAPLSTPPPPSKTPSRHRKRRRRQPVSLPSANDVTPPPPVAHSANDASPSRSPGLSHPHTPPTSSGGGGGRGCGSNFWSYMSAPDDGDSEVRLDRALAGLAAAVRAGVPMPAEAAAAVAAAMEAAETAGPPLQISPRVAATVATGAITTNGATSGACETDGVPLRLPRLGSSEVWHGFHPPAWAVPCGLAPAKVTSP